MKTYIKYLYLSLIFRLYPTFKEWKLAAAISVPSGNFSLYPTFKEWKLTSALYMSGSRSVYILPLRNENNIDDLLFSSTVGMFISYL